MGATGEGLKNARGLVCLRVKRKTGSDNLHAACVCVRVRVRVRGVCVRARACACACVCVCVGVCAVCVRGIYGRVRGVCVHMRFLHKAIPASPNSNKSNSNPVHLPV